MKITEKIEIEIELLPEEFKELQKNRMINSMCETYLDTAKKSGDFIVLKISRKEAEDFLGWVAGEFNHSTSSHKQEIFNSVCDAIEASMI